jgi:hypothetical protein
MMKKELLKIGILLLIALCCLTCSQSDNKGIKESADISSDSYTGGSENGNRHQQPGMMTAGEWNDLDNWTFWNNIIGNSPYSSMPDYWKFYNNNRVSVKVLTENGSPLNNAVVELKRNLTTIFIARTDNFGKAELWVDLFQKSESVDYSTISIAVNGNLEQRSIIPYSQGINEIIVESQQPEDRIEIALVVDATGSMGDELEYIKTELVNVIQRVKNNNQQSVIYTSAVFYRDEGDEYVTRVSNFSNDISVTSNFINRNNCFWKINNKK